MFTLFLARREFSKLVRVYEVVCEGPLHLYPRTWNFSGSRTGGPLEKFSAPGHCALGYSRETALNRLTANEELALEASYGSYGS